MNDTVAIGVPIAFIVIVFFIGCRTECRTALEEDDRTAISDTAPDGGLPDEDEMTDKYCDIYCSNADDCTLECVLDSGNPAEDGCWIVCYFYKEECPV